MGVERFARLIRRRLRGGKVIRVQFSVICAISAFLKQLVPSGHPHPGNTQSEDESVTAERAERAETWPTHPRPRACYIKWVFEFQR
jgi:hypothetical protein